MTDFHTSTGEITAVKLVGERWRSSSWVLRVAWYALIACNASSKYFPPLYCFILRAHPRIPQCRYVVFDLLKSGQARFGDNWRLIGRKQRRPSEQLDVFDRRRRSSQQTIQRT